MSKRKIPADVTPQIKTTLPAEVEAGLNKIANLSMGWRDAHTAIHLARDLLSRFEVKQEEKATLETQDFEVGQIVRGEKAGHFKIVEFCEMMGSVERHARLKIYDLEAGTVARGSLVLPLSKLVPMEPLAETDNNDDTQGMRP